MQARRRSILAGVYVLGTIQFAWCYMWLTRPYVNTALYEAGRERMPFQGRMLMMLPLRLAHSSVVMHWLTLPFAKSPFWFPRQVAPEVLVQAVVNVVALLAAGWLTTRMYQATSRRGLLTPFVYPLLLVACAATYIMHTVQNFRFIYDLPSLAFFAAAMYLMIFRWHPGWFVALFLVATVNRETTLLLLPLFMINNAVEGGELRWSKLFRSRTMVVVLPLAAVWVGWQVLVRHVFASNASEFYPRLDWNVKSMIAPHAWPQLLSACGYLLLFVVVMRKRITNARLRAWLWVLPLWVVFMFAFGILIETRVFGELIPFVVCASTLILEDLVVERMRARSGAERRPRVQIKARTPRVRSAA